MERKALAIPVETVIAPPRLLSSGPIRAGSGPSLTLLFFSLSFLWNSGCLPPDSATKSEGDGATEATAESSPAISEKAAPRKSEKPAFTGRHFHEAPSLAKRVRAGELPAVGERLPERPLILTPLEEPGQYGGTIRRPLIADIIDQTAVAKSLSENLMRYGRESPMRIRRNMAESYHFENDGKAVVFKLRKGIKWSDGAPFTVDDILFWYEDVASNENARNRPLFPSRWLNAGEPVTLEKLDAITLRISSEHPLGMILNTLCFDEIALPKHYFARFHPRYNATATYAEFRKQTTLAQLAYKPGTPRLSAWFPVFWTHGQKAVFERNPYYWKIDSEGNQLPYADRLEFSVIPSTDVILLKFINGELDLLGRYYVSRMFQTLRQMEAGGGFTVHLAEPGPWLSFYLNWDAPRSALREAFRNRSVRVALSHGINREEISEIVLHGLLDPTGLSLSRTSPAYSAEIALRYSRYDPSRARDLLEAAGYRDEDGDGIRELRDGTPFELTMDVFSNTDIPDICQLVAGYWKDIGIKSHLNIALQEIIVPRRINGDFDVHIVGSPSDPLIETNKFAITGPNEPFWYRNAYKEGPEWLKKMTALLEDAKTTVDPETLKLKLTEARDLYAEVLPFLSLGDGRSVWAARNNLGNVPSTLSTGDLSRGWDRAVFLEQIYFKRPGMSKP